MRLSKLLNASPKYVHFPFICAILHMCTPPTYNALMLYKEQQLNILPHCHLKKENKNIRRNYI